MKPDSDVTTSLHDCSPIPSLPGSLSHLSAALKAPPTSSTCAALLCFSADELSAFPSAWPELFSGIELLLLLPLW